MKLNFMQSIHNAVFQKISIVENELKSNTNFKVIFNIEYQTVESMQCFLLNNSLHLYWLFILSFMYFDTVCSNLQKRYFKGLFR